MKKYKNTYETIIFILNAAILCFTINSFCLIKKYLWLIPVVIILFLGANALPLYSKQLLPNKRFKICAHGTRCLKLFIISLVVTLVYHIAMAFVLIPETWTVWAFSALFAIMTEAILFWNGIISVYATSTQLGITTRILGIVFGMVPVGNLIMLGKIIKITSREINTEWQKCVLNLERKDQQICATKYPLLMVHGVFFRDSVKFNYWGRVPKELEFNGARIFYGNNQSALLVVDSAKELADRIKGIIEETGCEKVNIIAHSKGGIDTRFAIHEYGLEPYVASLTTINSPHRGCEFSDYVVNGMPEKIKAGIAATYNRTLKKLGDANPDFLAAVSDLSSSRCKPLDEKMGVPEGVFCQSYGSVIKHAVGGQFPLNFSYNLVKHFDGRNDGLVGEASFAWGEKFELLVNEGLRGISHGDVIDLNRKDIPGFDVREFYVQLVADLKNRGL